MTLDTSLRSDSSIPVSQSQKRVLWKWSVAATVGLFGFLMWQCGSTLMVGRNSSNAAVQHFHTQLNEEQYEQIFGDADDGFQQSGNKEETIKFLEGVHRKLGKAEQTNLTNLMVQASTGGTYVIVLYTTKFERGEAAEKFIWTKKDGQLKLHGYNVESKTLVIG